MDVFLTIVYCALCTCMLIYNYSKCQKLLNVLNVYLLIWMFMVTFYNMKLILYYDLSALTWILIFASTILVFLGYRFGNRLKVRHCSESAREASTKDSTLKKIIIVTSVLSMVAIVPNTLLLIQRYGINLLGQSSQIYADTNAGTAPFTVPYFSALAQVSCILAGIYFAKYGFHPIIILPLALVMISILPSGRGWLILTIFFFLYPMAFFKRKGTDENIKIINKRKRVDTQRKLILIMAVAIIFALFLAITVNRSKNIDTTMYQYLTPQMANIMTNTPWLMKMYQYFASPIGVLNAYLENPEFYFGGNTFGPLYNFLNKFGLSLEYIRYQKFYYIPFRTNVGTWLIELIQDFGFVGMLLVVTGFSVFVGYFDKKGMRNKQKEDILIAVIADTILTMSFFMWYLREGTMFVIVLTCIIMKLFRRRRYKVKVEDTKSEVVTEQPETAAEIGDNQ